MNYIINFHVLFCVILVGIMIVIFLYTLLFHKKKNIKKSTRYSIYSFTISVIIGCILDFTSNERYIDNLRMLAFGNTDNVNSYRQEDINFFDDARELDLLLEKNNVDAINDKNKEIDNSHTPDDETVEWLVNNRDDVIFKDDIFDVSITVRHKGDEEWHSFIDASVGDELEFQICYSNTTNYKAEDVIIRALLPNNMSYVPGTSEIYDFNHPMGAKINSDSIVSKDGINTGSYASGANSFIRLSAIVADKNLYEGNNCLSTWAKVTSNGETLWGSCCDIYIKK